MIIDLEHRRNIARALRKQAATGDCQGERQPSALLCGQLEGSVALFIQIDTLLSKYDPDWHLLSLNEKAARRQRMFNALRHAGLLRG